MKLTTEQVEDIENILNQKGIKYDDLKFEIVDHIASEIENEMEKSDTNFVETTALVFSRWEPEFKPIMSFLFSKKYPKIYKDKLLKIIKIQGLSTAFLCSLFLILFYFFSDVNQRLEYLFLQKNHPISCNQYRYNCQYQENSNNPFYISFYYIHTAILQL